MHTAPPPISSSFAQSAVEEAATAERRGRTAQEVAAAECRARAMQQPAGGGEQWPNLPPPCSGWRGRILAPSGGQRAAATPTLRATDPGFAGGWQGADGSKKLAQRTTTPRSTLGFMISVFFHDFWMDLYDFYLWAFMSSVNLTGSSVMTENRTELTKLEFLSSGFSKN